MVFNLEQGDRYNDKAVAELQAECGALQNSLQQLKAEIAAIVERLQRAYAMRESPDVLDCISELRQLSAV